MGDLIEIASLADLATFASNEIAALRGRAREIREAAKSIRTNMTASMIAEGLRDKDAIALSDATVAALYAFAGSLEDASRIANPIIEAAAEVRAEVKRYRDMRESNVGGFRIDK